MPEMREILTELGCPANTHSYLGDGVYCGVDSLPQVWLVVERDYGIHKIALEETVLAALYRYASERMP